MPLGGSGKAPGSPDKKPTMPGLLGGKTNNAFASNPSKSYPSTSSTTPKKSSTAFGFIWIPGRKNRKKEYVHVAHNDNYGRSPSMYPSEFNYNMSGDSSNHQPFKRKDEESSLLTLEKPKGPIATAASAGTAVVVLDDKPPQAPEGIDPNNPEDKDKEKEKPEKSEFIRYDKEESKEAGGDGQYDDKDSKSFLENDTLSSKTPDRTGKDRGDKVDSVYLRPPPPHKVRSNISNDDEDCCIKCIYYTQQCCDCVLM